LHGQEFDSLGAKLISQVRYPVLRIKQSIGATREQGSWLAVCSNATRRTTSLRSPTLPHSGSSRVWPADDLCDAVPCSLQVQAVLPLCQQPPMRLRALRQVLRPPAAAVTPALLRMAAAAAPAAVMASTLPA
jgi:hypothetical protein